MLAAKQLCKKVPTEEGELTILDNVSFSIEEGSSLAIVGASGSGKTTLLGLLAGLDQPSDGEVIFARQSIFRLSEEQLAAIRMNNIGFVFQNFQLIDGLSALENVMLPLELKGDNNARAKARDILQKVELGSRLNHRLNQLSGGEQQRVAIARAFVSQPKLLFADEPTGNLDTVTGQKIIDLMFELNQSFQTTLVLVTHDRNLADRCDLQLELEAGKVISFNGASLAEKSDNTENDHV